MVTDEGKVAAARQRQVVAIVDRRESDLFGSFDYYVRGAIVYRSKFATNLKT